MGRVGAAPRQAPAPGRGNDNVNLRSGCTQTYYVPRLCTPTRFARVRYRGAGEDSDSLLATGGPLLADACTYG